MRVMWHTDGGAWPLDTSGFQVTASISAYVYSFEHVRPQGCKSIAALYCHETRLFISLEHAHACPDETHGEEQDHKSTLLYNGELSLVWRA